MDEDLFPRAGEPLGQPMGQPLGQAAGQPLGQPYGAAPGQPVGQPVGQPMGQPFGGPYGRSLSDPLDRPYLRAAPGRGQWSGAGAMDRSEGNGRVIAAATTLGLGALAGLAAYAALAPKAPARHQASAPAPRMADDAPGRTARQARFGDYAVTGRSVTIDRPREEIYAFWRHFSNLPKFMENIERVRDAGNGVSAWTIRAPLGMTVEVRVQTVNDRPGEQIAWRSTPDSQVATEGKVMFRDAPAGRGTVVEAVIAYKPPMGAVGQAIAKLFSAEPSVQSRRDLKRLKMLLETGEIATNENQRGKGGKFQAALPDAALSPAPSSTFPDTSTGASALPAV